MHVILLEHIRGLGKLGDKVCVKPGYSRNYLIPQGKAVRATTENIKYFEEQRLNLEKKEQDRLVAAKNRAEALANLHVKVSAKASEEGKLYGSVSALEIVKAVEESGVKICKQEVQLPNGPFRAIGDYEVQLYLDHGEAIATLKLSVIAEE